MKAIVQDGFGSDALRLIEVDVPPARAGQVLVRQRASSVNSADWHFVAGVPLVMRLGGKPRGVMRGMDVAGVVAAIGADVSDFAVGDEVWGTAARGAWAEYVRVPAARLARKPAAPSFVDAGASPLAGTTALQALRDVARVTAGQRVLVIGASGGVGTFAVQIAKSMGAFVTGVARGEKADVVRAAGADRVVDYMREDFAGGERYDVVLDLTASRRLGELRRALLPTGTLVLAGGGGGRYLGPVPLMLHAGVRGRFGPQTLRSFTAKHTRERLDALGALMERGAVHPIVERAWPLAEAEAAMRWFDAGRGRGKQAIVVA